MHSTCRLSVWVIIDTFGPTSYDSRSTKDSMANYVKFPRAVLLLAAAILLAAGTPAQPADPARYLNDVKSLASPEMEGRGAGTKGLTRAEHLIEKRYKELGLQPAGAQGYAQPFTVVTGARLKSDNEFAVESGGSKKNL